MLDFRIWGMGRAGCWSEVDDAELASRSIYPFAEFEKETQTHRNMQISA
jgi:hypothetical protein